VRIGLLSDIHGSRHALEAVPVDAAALRIDAWWVLGDLAAIGPDPVGAVEVVATCRTPSSFGGTRTGTC
jgi:hypothetical protein